MPIVKCVFGAMLIVASVGEYPNYYSQVGRHSASAIAILSVFAVVGLLFIYSGIKKKKVFGFVNKKSVIATVCLLAIAYLADYVYDSVFMDQTIKMAETEFVEHGFAIQLPSTPDIKKFEPNPGAGLEGMYHFMAVNGPVAFIVVYADFDETVFTNTSKKEFLERQTTPDGGHGGPSTPIHA